MAGDTPLIRVEGVWKKFRRGELHDSLRDVIPMLLRRATTWSQPLSSEEFWAVRDLSFVVEPGQALGIIGPNGAGKSTLLKILSRIFRPNRGAYTVRGRIGSLIEVAAGFHQDLTGRENIFLQGAIMGMSRAHTRSKIDQIIAFSAIEEFIDTPVKRYSSGMNARLGFSIAAHMDPDVMILDEVLAVGDYEFQRRAFARVKELASSGMPVVVVSHQLDRIAELCTSAVLLTRGAMVCQGAPVDVIGAYLRGASRGGETLAADTPVVLGSATVLGSSEVRSGGSITFRIEGDAGDVIPRHVEPLAVFVRSAQSGKIAFATGCAAMNVSLGVGRFQLDVTLQMNVQPGIYLVDTGVWDRAEEKQLMVGPSLTLRVTDGTLFMGEANLNPAMTLVPLPAEAESVHT